MRWRLGHDATLLAHPTTTPRRCELRQLLAHGLFGMLRPPVQKTGPPIPPHVLGPLGFILGTLRATVAEGYRSQDEMKLAGGSSCDATAPTPTFFCRRMVTMLCNRPLSLGRRTELDGLLWISKMTSLAWTL